MIHGHRTLSRALMSDSINFENHCTTHVHKNQSITNLVSDKSKYITGLIFAFHLNYGILLISTRNIALSWY